MSTASITFKDLKHAKDELNVLVSIKVGRKVGGKLSQAQLIATTVYQRMQHATAERAKGQP